MKNVLWIFALLIASFAFAYDIKDFVRDAKAYHERNLSAMNGLTLEVTGRITQPGQEVYLIDATYSMRGTRWRTDAVLKNADGGEGFPMIVLFDGTQTWARILGMKIEVPRDDVDDRVRGYLYWEEPAVSSVVAGEATINGRACWIIETPLKESDGTPVTLRSWYDKEHYVLVQSESTLGAKPVRMEFSDFRSVQNGYTIPFAMRAVQNDAQIVNAQIISASPGTALSDSLFDSALLEGEDFPSMNELMRTMQIFGKVFTNEVSKLLKNN